MRLNRTRGVSEDREDVGRVFERELVVNKFKPTYFLGAVFAASSGMVGQHATL